MLERILYNTLKMDGCKKSFLWDLEELKSLIKKILKSLSNCRKVNEKINMSGLKDLLNHYITYYLH